MQQGSFLRVIVLLCAVQLVASAIPTSNWKQCVWRVHEHDSGIIKECLFNKLEDDTALRVAYQGDLRASDKGKCNRWYFKFNGVECSGPKTIEALIANFYSFDGTLNLHRNSQFEGYCENIKHGVISVELWVGECPGKPLGDANTGWEAVSRIMIEEVHRSQ